MRRMAVEAESELKFLDPKKLKFFKDEDGKVGVVIEGEGTFRRIILRRCFPLTMPDRYISVRNEDDEEIGLIRELRQLDPKSRKIVEEELRRRYFMPVILKVKALREKFGFAEWEVETDKGPRTFIASTTSDSLLYLEERRIIITDIDGNRYEIPDWAKLDSHSLALLSRLL